MKEKELVRSLSAKQQATYEQELICAYGDGAKKHIDESNHNMKEWTPTDWQASQKEFDAICKLLTASLENNLAADSSDVQHIIDRHHAWLKKFWTPNKESYAGLGSAYTSDEYAKVFTPYHPELALFMAAAMKEYAEKELA